MMSETHGIWRIERRDEVDSSNDEAARLIAAGALTESPFLAVLAQSQSAGKGRAERAWQSPAGGGLWFSLALRPDKEPEHLAQITLLAAVAVERAVRQASGVAARIKWPNDLLVDGKKVCGILTETRPLPEPDAAGGAKPQGVSQTDPAAQVKVGADTWPDAVIVGIGLNVNQPAFAGDLDGVATSLAIACGRSFDKDMIFFKILDVFHTLYETWLADGFGSIRAHWIEASCTLGRDLSWEENGARRAGRAVDLETDGSLRVCMEGGEIHRLNAGEIRFLRAAQ